MDAAEQWAQWWESHPDVLPAEFVKEIVRAKGELDAALMSEEDRENDPEDLYTGRAHRVALLRAHAADVPPPPKEYS